MTDRIPGALLRTLVDATVAAFTRDELARAVRLSLDEDLDDLVKPMDLTSMTYELLLWAERNGATAKLVEGLRGENPNNSDLTEAAGALESMSAPSSKQTKAAVASEPPPGAIRAGLSTVSPEGVRTWTDGMLRASRSVCRLELPGGVMATAVLIGPRLVLTVRHVVADLIGGRGDSEEVGLRFDYIEGRTPAEGRLYRLADEWLIDEDADLDFALMLMSKPTPDAPARTDWLRPASTQPGAEGEPLFVLGHVQGRTAELECVWHTATAPNNRRWYRTDGVRKPGTSGAPVCTSDWRLLALHRAIRPNPDGAQHSVVGGEGSDALAIFRRPAVRVALAVSDA